MRLLFLDRDGTLNRSLGHRPPNAPDEVVLLPNVAPVLLRCVEDGWQPVIVTNQGGVARGYLTEAQARAVLQRTIDLLPVPVAAAYLCPHMPGAPISRYDLDCPNRKPRPGFVLRALEAFGARPEDCLFVGDATTDRQAADAAGMPFCWADRFFARPIDRGMQTRDGAWFQVRAAPEAGEEELRLLALVRGVAAGRLALAPTASSDPGVASLDLYVDAAYRRQGIGSALVRTALEWAPEHGIDRVCVDVEADDPAAQAFARRWGFDRAAEGSRCAAFGREAVAMSLEVSSREAFSGCACT